MFSPHVRDDSSTSKLMLMVVIALIPTMVVSVFNYGYLAVKVYLLTIIFSLAFEAVFQKMRRVNFTLNDNSALLTAILLAMNMPPSAPWWLCMAGSFVAIVVSKQVFGGLGHNPFNPALVGRIFLLIAWPAQMTGWIQPNPITQGFIYDAVSAATPMGQAKAELIQHGKIITQNIAPIWDTFLGTVSGCLGGDSAIAVLIGGILLITLRVIRWHIPVIYLGSFFIFVSLYWLAFPEKTLNPMIHTLSGGLMLGAFFMATDYVTSPMSVKGQVIFAIGCGFLTFVIRIFGSYPEGVAFAILIMNAFVPLLDSYIKPKSFGEAGK